MADPVTIKNLVTAAFTAGMVWAGIKSAQKRQVRQGRAITRLLQYKAWSHRALSVLISHHASNHPGQFIIEDWREVEEGNNGGSDGND